MNRFWLFFITWYGLSLATVQAQIKPLASNEIAQGLQKLNTLGSVLYFAAHPDDENTRLIAWLAQEKKYRTAYLSLTRGDGGQNLIGTEQGVDLGLIRTQELLAARALDKGEQFFSSAYDFGFSKTHPETFSFWDKQTALREAVWIIRKFRPDIIINRFPPDKRGGHGHHQASAILAQEAFVAAADPNAFPDQLSEVEPWQAKRLLWNTANFGGQNNTSEDQLKIDIGAYNPLLGQSYGEIAAHSRSQHKSQGFGAATSRGKYIEYFALVDGPKADTALLEGVETTWRRIPNSKPIQQLIDKLIREYQPAQPEKSIPSLIALRKLVGKINDPYWKEQKIKEIDQLIVACAGLHLEAYTAKPSYPVGKNFDAAIEVVVQNPNVSVELMRINDTSLKQPLRRNHVFRQEEMLSWPNITQPYWLVNTMPTIGKFDVQKDDVGYPTNRNNPHVDIVIRINDQELRIPIAIKYKSVDPVWGERYQVLVITPQLIVDLPSKNSLSINGQAQEIEVTFTRMDNALQQADVQVDATNGWEIVPKQIVVDFGNHASIVQKVRVKPRSAEAQKGNLFFTWNGRPLHGMKTIAYDHIPTITWFPKAEVTVQNLTLTNPVQRVAYLAGAGDLIPQALEQIGIETTLLKPDQLSVEALKKYDALIVGVRFFNVNPEADKVAKIILQYVEQGGTALIQYNVNTKLHSEHIGPYPFTIGRARVTEEDAIVTFDAKDPAMNYPNKISPQDFDNWIQERGLYFTEKIADNYRTPLQMRDQGEENHNGSLLIANYGKGKFVYTSLSFFRQLPAGVPGAYRLFVNLLAKEK